jgi:hypothetical protein
MKASYWFVLAALLTGPMLGRAQAQDDDAIIAEDADLPEGVEVLTRGPIHEAFAMPVTGEVKPTFIVPKEPPGDIEEVPPEFKPEGDDVIWIPGYWSWDDEREDFIWVSGVWRKTPPKQRWVPGYWDKADEGWRWTSGFWTPIVDETITYYDPPPETIEAGPTSTAPGDNYFWTPGVWNYYDTGYKWRPGYWAVSQPNWIWIPDRWAWTPSGAVFIPGYWDYTLAARGCAFSPVYINSTVYAQPSFSWRPRFALNTAALMVNFWVRPNYCHYYFGNYYGGNYGQWGYTPMAQYWGRRSGWGWDPIVAYNQAYYRGRGINYVNRMNDWHRFYVNHPNRRPPATWRDQVNIVQNKKVTVNNITNITNVNHIIDNDVNVVDNSANIVALPVDKIARARRNDPDLRMAKIDDRQRDQAQAHAKQIRNVNHERSKAESESAVASRDRQLPRDADPKHGQVRNKMKLPAVAKTPEDRPGRDATAGRDTPRRPDRDAPTAHDDRPGHDIPAARDGKPAARDTARDDKPTGRNDKREGRDAARSGRDTIPGRSTARDDRPGRDPTPDPTDNKSGRSDDRSRPGKSNLEQFPIVEPGRDGNARTPEPRRPQPRNGGDNGHKPGSNLERFPIVEPGRDGYIGRVTPEPKPERRQLKADRATPKANTRLEPRRADKPEVRPQPRRELQRKPPAEARPQPRVESRPQPRTESGPRPEPRSEPKNKAKEKKPDTRSASHSSPRSQPRAASRQAARPQPQSRTASRPRPESRPQPRAESHPQPRHESSHPSGGSSHKPEGGKKADAASKGKGKDNDKNRK